jgi:hypothetical protein
MNLNKRNGTLCQTIAADRQQHLGVAAKHMGQEQ